MPVCFHLIHTVSLHSILLSSWLTVVGDSLEVTVESKSSRVGKQNTIQTELRKKQIMMINGDESRTK